MLRLKIILTTILLLHGSSYVVAQDYVPLVLNPKIGVNFSDLVVAESEQISGSAKMGWNLGFDIRYGTKFMWKGGVHFYSTGSAWQVADTSHSMNKLTAHQIKFPIGAGVKVLRIEYFNLWLFADGVLNYTIDVKHDVEKSYIEYPKTGLSGRLGLSMDLSRFTMELTFERSFTDLISEDLAARNRMVNLSIGLKL
ncbi:MAG: PorT family protein [Saprospiraceae bacterium]|nr:PorT family protein [Saprospiraceae bacterium]